ncbi:hypothetical protein SASPL_116420 [Salvia splendens]|uniref:Vinorine synthase n=1 Tax=Salvia splendens TaxID=180675 RepID=A0A8X8ZWU8_SALSN|nr:hypothetical protein SASPL_116420 [Salvia splendens]
MRVEVQSRQLVKPATATPSHLRRYNISMIDDLNPPMHVIRILYYPPHTFTLNLEDPLSQILPSFYPLAGRYLKPLHAVDCNDADALFSRALVHSHLLPLLADPSLLNALLPVDISAADGPDDPMLAVQLNTFLCGGVAVAVCGSHRIFDACSLSVFLAAWAEAALGEERTIRPDFGSAALFPSESAAPLDFGVGERRIVGKRIVFDKEAIATLRARANSDPDMEGVTLSRAPYSNCKSGPNRPHDKRAREDSPARVEACVRDLGIHIARGARSGREEGGGADFPKLPREMREATMRGIKDFARILSDKEFGRWALVDSYAEIAEKGLIREDYKVIYVTDWSKFGDYELDFGFGKAIWVSLADVPLEDLMILMNTRENDGIEAWVYLDELDMTYFEKDQHIQMLLA